ncbi:MAG TPA: cytochrome c1 [Acetobacteraceae bacterium]|jgi:ubiquinol-cytochrome c reductase cytochrome c1 subunit|nr:cytochrome c1 [Acetobacteraceae bacterium]
MRAVHSIFAALALGGLAAAGLGAADLATAPAVAQETPELPHQQWSWQGPFGTFDLAAAQRGFQVYSEVCSTCHSMKELHYRDLAGIGLTPEQIQAVAAAVTVPQGLDDQGQPKEGPGTPGSQFRSPFPNEQAARAALNGALPPDLSLIVNAREGGPDYVYGILTGFADAPKGFTMQPGMNYNEVFPGHQIAMPQPLHDGQVAFADGSPNNIGAEAHDVVTFLAWAANPELVERKQIGWRVILFLVVMTGLTYAVKRKTWADVEH